MPSYRLVFPAPPGTPIENSPTAHIESGDTIYEVGALIEHRGQKWRVSQAPLEDPRSGETLDLLVWPAE